MRQKIITLFFVSFSFLSLKAQENLGPSDGEASGPTGAFQYTLGQVVFNSAISETGSMVCGVNQPYGISVTGLEAEEVNLNIVAYPNPTTHYLILKVNEHRNLNYELYSLNGKLIDFREVVQSEIQIDMSGLPSTAYILKVISYKKEIKSFKVIKSN